MNFCGSKIRSAIRRAGVHLVANSFELAASHVGQVLPLGTRGGPLIQEDWNLELSSHAVTDCASENDAVLHRRALERDEGHDVGRTHARMLASVVIEIDSLTRGANAG